VSDLFKGDRRGVEDDFVHGVVWRVGVMGTSGAGSCEIVHPKGGVWG
jgi:hypothetical protein